MEDSKLGEVTRTLEGLFIIQGDLEQSGEESLMVRFTSIHWVDLRMRFEQLANERKRNMSRQT